MGGRRELEDELVKKMLFLIYGFKRVVQEFLIDFYSLEPQTCYRPYLTTTLDKTLEP